MHSTEDRGAEEKTEDVVLGENKPNPGDVAVVDVGDGFAKRPSFSAVDVG